MSHSLSEKTQASAGGTPAASARELYKVYGTGDTEVRALDGISV